MVKFNDLLDDDEESVIDPRDIFLTLERDKRFSFPRDIQTEVMKSWFASRDQADTIIKLNVGSGKTLVGMLLLQSSLNEGKGPAIYVCPDKQLVSQVLVEAELLGMDVTDEPRDPKFASSEKICVTTIHKIFNGRSIFGIGAGGIKIKIGSLVVDDAHACIAAVSDQFRVSLPNSHKSYSTIFDLVSNDLKRQSKSQFLDLAEGDPRAVMEVPFWSWQDHHDAILAILHAHRNDDELLFSYPLLSEVMPFCRCFIGGKKLEIEPTCPPTDLIRAFSRAERRIYMTATLSDDSVLVTHFGANPEKLQAPIVPISSQSMGERMILMPQELNPDIEIMEIKNLLVKLSKKTNVVVIVPSKPAADHWHDDADQILMADNVVGGIEKLRNGHVGLTVLVNRYDGIDLPHDACRVLAIFDLPEVASFREAADMTVLSNSEFSLRRQMQRIEQGMGRGVRSNDDHCVVLLWGAKLASRLKSPDGRAMLTSATQAQLDLSTKLAKKLNGTDIDGIEEVIGQCLDRDADWVKVSKKALLKAKSDTGLNLDPIATASRIAFDSARLGDHTAAMEILNSVASKTSDQDLKAWLQVRLAEMTHTVDPARAQKIVLSARKLNSNVLKPIEGIAYQKLKPVIGKQAAAVQKYHSGRFLEAVDRVLYTKSVIEDLQFDPERTDEFEAAIDTVAKMVGIGSQRPEKQIGDGPDNLWAFPDGTFLVIECKSGSTSHQGISKHDLGQLDQAMTWFKGKYMEAIPVSPIIVHPLRALGQGATKVADMRIINATGLAKLKKAFEEFNKSLGDLNVMNDVARIADLLETHSLTASSFVNCYTTTVKK